jgi:hypothetical protein
MSTDSTFDSVSRWSLTNLSVLQCDEHMPACGNCMRHSVQCDFLLTQSHGMAANSPATTPHVSSLELS